MRVKKAYALQGVKLESQMAERTEIHGRAKVEDEQVFNQSTSFIASREHSYADNCRMPFSWREFVEC